MKKKYGLLINFLSISILLFSQDLIAVNSGLPDGIRIGQISEDMNDADALWDLAINKDGTINDAFTKSTDNGQTWVVGGALGILIYGGNLEFIEEFESYNAGDQLVAQAVGMGIDYWTTWSSSPGSAEDPYVSDEFAFSGNNSVVIEGTNDAVLLFGDKTEGVYNVSFHVLIPTGFYGYFNILQDFAGTASQWGTQAYFDAGGIGTIDAGGAGAGVFNYSYDTWTFVEIMVDLDSDWSEIYVDGNFIIEWQWSTGTFGTGTLNQLSAMNLYAWNVNGTPKAFFDDIDFEMVTPVEIYEDFEAYSAGDQLVAQALGLGIDYWDTWSSSPGSAEDPYVTDEVAQSGSNSVVIEETNDAVLLFGDKTSGAYSVEFSIYVPTGFFGYFNILQDFAGASSQWGTQAYFDAGGIGTIDAGGAGAGVFNYNYDEWTDVQVDVDLDADWSDIYVNGALIISWQWSTGTFGTGTLNQLSAMNLYAWNANGTPKAFFDDITLTQTAGPGGDPIIEVTPVEFTFEVAHPGSETQNMNVSNVGTDDLDYSITVVYTQTDEAIHNPKMITGDLVESFGDEAVIHAEGTHPESIDAFVCPAGSLLSQPATNFASAYT
nr:hypothetical protein [Bacteroidota bacterium]